MFRESSEYFLLWFGDERGYNATIMGDHHGDLWLWFGDERGYNATHWTEKRHHRCCGLVMKEDITQQRPAGDKPLGCCGLVMKEDITQLGCAHTSLGPSCGLVMKEDITQRSFDQDHLR